MVIIKIFVVWQVIVIILLFLGSIIYVKVVSLFVNYISIMLICMCFFVMSWLYFKCKKMENNLFNVMVVVVKNDVVIRKYKVYIFVVKR